MLAASGFAAKMRFRTALVSSASDVPVMLAPGASSEATSPQEIGSETAEKTTGMSVPSVSACIEMATGVATPIIRSTPSALKFEMIWARTFASALQLSYSTSNVTPFCSPMAASCVWMLSTIWLRDASST